MSSSDFTHLMGWIKTPPKQMNAFMATLPMPYFSDVNQKIKGTGKGTVLLYEFYRKLSGGKDGLKIQEGPDCTAFGADHALIHAEAADIVMRGDLDEWNPNGFSTEVIYAGSRVNVGGGRLGNGGGSYGSWTADFCNRFVIAPRAKYGRYDLTRYNYSTAANWGSPGVGVPREILEANKGKRIKTVSLVRTFQEVADCIANGIAVTIASNCGFTSTRDKYGRCRASGSWPHQMAIIGVINTNELQMVCIANSWGKYMSGPLYLNQPEESFWCDASDLERYILSANDSWAYSDVVGFERKELKLGWV